MVVSVIMAVVMGMMVVVRHFHGIHSEGHGFHEGVQAKAQKGDEAEPVPVDMAVLHTLAEVLKPDLKEKADDDPTPGTAVHGERFGKQMEEAQPQKECPSESQQQRQLLLETRPNPFAEQASDQGDQYQSDSCRHDLVAKRMSLGVWPFVQGVRSY